MLSRDMIGKLPVQQLMQMMQDPRYKSAFPSIVAALTQRQEIKSKLAKGGEVKAYAEGGGVYGGANAEIGEIAKALAERGVGYVRDVLGVPEAVIEQVKRMGGAVKDFKAMPYSPWFQPKGGDAPVEVPPKGGLTELAAAQTPSAAPQAKPAPTTPSDAAKKQQVAQQVLSRMGATAPAAPAVPTGLVPYKPTDIPQMDRGAMQNEQMAALQKQFPDQYAAYMEKLKAREGAADKQFADDKTMALLQTGLGIMGGTSQNALQNIAQGGLGGLAAYKEAVGTRNKAKEGLEDKMFQGQLAQQQAQMKLLEMARGMARDEFTDKMTEYGLKTAQADKIWQAANEDIKFKVDRSDKAREFGLKERQLGLQSAQIASAAQDRKEAREDRKTVIKDAMDAKFRSSPLYQQIVAQAEQDALKDPAVKQYEAGLFGIGGSKMDYQRELDTAFERHKAKLLSRYGFTDNIPSM